MKNENGDAPLHCYISQNRKYELLIAILSCGRNIDVNIQNEEGHTPLHIAAKVSYWKICFEAH